MIQLAHSEEPVAIFSPDRKHRYTLWREVNTQGYDYVMWIALNPSTADEKLDDPTVRRMQGFTRAWGARYCLVTNVFAFRATDPKVMKAQFDPFGPDNLPHIGRLVNGAQTVVAAWGVHGNWVGGEDRIKTLMGGFRVEEHGRSYRVPSIQLKCLGKTKHGHPKHPLYVRADTQLIDYP